MKEERSALHKPSSAGLLQPPTPGQNLSTIIRPSPKAASAAARAPVVLERVRTPGAEQGLVRSTTSYLLSVVPTATAAGVGSGWFPHK